jgi:hypothetical protein
LPYASLVNFPLDLFSLTASFSVDFLDVLEHRCFIAFKLPGGSQHVLRCGISPSFADRRIHPDSRDLEPGQVILYCPLDIGAASSRVVPSAVKSGKLGMRARYTPFSCPTITRYSILELLLTLASTL